MTKQAADARTHARVAQLSSLRVCVFFSTTTTTHSPAALHHHRVCAGEVLAIHKL
jgi:hypothetical protein